MNIDFTVQSDSTALLSKPALIFIEGNHVDSKGRPHSFSREIVEEYVANTNQFLAQGGTLPWQMDHKKTQDANIGEVLDSELKARYITKEDVESLYKDKAPKFQHLVGKFGVFVDSLTGKGQKVVQMIKDKVIKTLSPGLDPVKKRFVEISATPLPAIVGPAVQFSSQIEDEFILFDMVDLKESNSKISSVQNKKVFSLLDLRRQKASESNFKEDFLEKAEELFQVLFNIYTATEPELEGEDPIELSYSTISEFIMDLEDMFELVSEDNLDEEVNPELKDNLTPPKSTIQDPNFSKKQLGYRMNNRGQISFKKRISF